MKSNIDELTKTPLTDIITDGGFTAIFRTIGIVGDSLSSGEHEFYDGVTRKYCDYYEYSWGQFIARKCGLTAYNFSVGGMTAKEFNSFANYCKCYTAEKLCQAYIIALGRNDMNAWDKYEYGFGKITDIDFKNPDNNKDSFVGHYAKIIQKLKIVQPKATIFVVTMPKSSSDAGERDCKCDRHAEFLRSLVELFDNLYVIDLRKYAPVHDDNFVSRYYLEGHLNAMGYLITAEQISTYIDYIIRNNYEKFKDVAFIGKNII